MRCGPAFLQPSSLSTISPSELGSEANDPLDCVDVEDLIGEPETVGGSGEEEGMDGKRREGEGWKDGVVVGESSETTRLVPGAGGQQLWLLLGPKRTRPGSREAAERLRKKKSDSIDDDGRGEREADRQRR